MAVRPTSGKNAKKTAGAMNFSNTAKTPNTLYAANTANAPNAANAANAANAKNNIRASNGAKADNGAGLANQNGAQPTVPINKSGGRRQNRIEVKGIILAALGAIFMFAFFRDNSIGAFGATVKSIAFGLFGWPAYFIPSVIIIAGFMMILSNKNGKIFGLPSLYVLMLFVIASALFHTFYYNAANYINQSPFILMPRFYFEAQKMDGTGGGGGFMGALLAMPFINILSAIGARILLSALLLIDILLLTNVSAAAFLRGVSKTAGQGAQAIGRRLRTNRLKHAGDARAAANKAATNGTGDYYISENEFFENGVDTNGLAKNGLAKNGLVENGLAENGLAENISTENELIEYGGGVPSGNSDGGVYNDNEIISFISSERDKKINQEIFFKAIDNNTGEAGNDDAASISDGVSSGVISFPARVSKINFTGFDESNNTDTTDTTDTKRHTDVALYPIKKNTAEADNRIKKPPLRWSVAPVGKSDDDHARRFFSDADAPGGSNKSISAANNEKKKLKDDKGKKNRLGAKLFTVHGEGDSSKKAGSSTKKEADSAGAPINIANHVTTPARAAPSKIDMAITRENVAVGHAGNGEESRRDRIHAAINAAVGRNGSGGWEMLAGSEEFAFNDESKDMAGWSSIDGFQEAKSTRNTASVKAKASIPDNPKPIQKPKQKQTIKPAPKFQPINKNSVQYRFPPLAFLDENPDKRKNMAMIKAHTQEVAVRLEETLLSFKVRARVINVTRGPSVTQYEVLPDVGVKVSTIVNLAEDISLKLGVTGIRIAPVADRSAIGIEVPNKEASAVVLRDIVATDSFMNHQSKLAFAVGVDIAGNAVMADISKMPHLLIAGATGSGKSVFVTCLILSLLYRTSPDDVKLIMIDPKVVELGVYNGIPHLMIPVVTDPRKAAGALAWAVQEMLGRYQAFSERKVKDLAGYNAYIDRVGDGEKLPRIVIIIDELADLMMAAPKEVQDAICRLAQMARAAGMHLVVATQRPTVDVITGLIKSNIPSRIAFRVASQTDSRVILDTNGAEKLQGKGDMLFYPVGEKKPLRVQGAFISEAEVDRVIEYIKVALDVEYDEEMIDKITGASSNMSESNPGDNDELLPSVIEHVVEAGLASTSMIQRKFKVGYARAARIIDQMEARGIVSGFDGSKPRQILITRQQMHEMKL